MTLNLSYKKLNGNHANIDIKIFRVYSYLIFNEDFTSVEKHTSVLVYSVSQLTCVIHVYSCLNKMS